MSLKNVMRITTEDTKKTYEFPGEDNPQLWAVQLQIDRVDGGGHAYFNSHLRIPKTIHVERETLENAGLLPMKKEIKDASPTETPEDLILRLLEHVGVYPSE